MSKILVTGGCGFIGSNVMDRMLGRGEHAVAFDNLSRRGAVKNAEWLSEKYGRRFELVQGDVRDAGAIAETAKDADVIYHFAAQVAVTTSVANPRHDFDVNAFGTLNTLEAARASGKNPVFIFASTNKVYGAMDDVEVIETPTRYAYMDLPGGVSEVQPLDFHSPYGCSKGSADQYVRDYARIYGLRSVVFRQSAIYGYRQFGEEDQGPTSQQVAVHEQELKKYGKVYEFHTYPGAGHGFFYHHRPSYRQEQAVDGWNKVFDFLDKHLKSAAG